MTPSAKPLSAEESARSLVRRLEKYASDHPESPLSQTLIDVVETTAGVLATLDAERALGKRAREEALEEAAQTMERFFESGIVGQPEIAAAIRALKSLGPTLEGPKGHSAACKMDGDIDCPKCNALEGPKDEVKEALADALRSWVKVMDDMRDDPDDPATAIRERFAKAERAVVDAAMARHLEIGGNWYPHAVKLADACAALAKLRGKNG